MTSGSLPTAGEPVKLGPGDVALARGPDHYTLADDPGTAPTVFIHPGQSCRSPAGEPMAEAMSLGVRTWGNDPDGETVMLIGAYEQLGDISDRLLRALPPKLALTGEQWDCPLIPLLCDEVVKDEPGQSAVLDRLLDLLLIAALRAWFVRPEAEAPAWYRAQGDPIIGRGAAHHAQRSITAPGRWPCSRPRVGVSRAGARAAFSRSGRRAADDPS